ncbi:MAG TPA: mechanosensitive ion channel family protein [Bryobacteraceae bacterium]|jgi:small-conductance mechanosensitive channel|nr:mechanosensitive ion channel family protein [Bryobacteraceae bacterium]
MLSQLIRPELWMEWAERGIRVMVILMLAWIFSRVTGRLLAEFRNYTLRIIDRRHEGSTYEMEKRATTLISVLTKISTLLIWLIALVMALSEMNFRIEPLLAGFGIAGIAVGLGAQTLVKDWLGGLFILLEDQLRIGDGVVINGISGSVEEINLRTTILRGENGAVHVIANGSITTLSNLTREYSYYVFETTLAHSADVDKALAILEAAGSDLAADGIFGPLILSPMEVMGIDRLAERGVTVKARIKTLPSKQAAVGRELNRRVKLALARAGIDFPPVTR